MYYQRIKYFLKTIETGSFKKAAEQLYITPPALAKQISLLEESLGVKLFERTPYGVKPTDIGRFAAAKFEHVDRELDFAVSQIQQLALKIKPNIKIAIFSSLPQAELVTPFVSFMLSGFPEYQISIEMVELDQGKLLMMENQIDFLLTNTHEEDNWENYKMLSFGAHPAKVVVSLMHPWAMKEKLTAEDLKTETFFKMHMEPGKYTLPDSQTFYANIPAKRVLEVSNFNTLFTMLNQANGFAVFPDEFAYRNQAKIKCFDFPGKSLMYHTAIVYNPNSSSAVVGNVAKELQEYFELTEI